MNRRRFFTTAGVIISSAFLPLEALADTTYYGKVDKKKSQEAAYIVFDEVKVKSKYHDELPEKNDPNYDKILAQRNKSVNKAVEDVAKDKSYDVVVEKDDPKLTDYTNISDSVITKMEKNEE